MADKSVIGRESDDGTRNRRSGAGLRRLPGALPRLLPPEADGRPLRHLLPRAALRPAAQVRRAHRPGGRHRRAHPARVPGQRPLGPRAGPRHPPAHPGGGGRGRARRRDRHRRRHRRDELPQVGRPDARRAAAVPGLRGQARQRHRHPSTSAWPGAASRPCWTPTCTCPSRGTGTARAAGPRASPTRCATAPSGGSPWTSWCGCTPTAWPSTGWPSTRATGRPCRFWKSWAWPASVSWPRCR